MDLDLFLNTAAVIADQVLVRVLDILKAPFEFKEMIWIIIPLLITMILMEFYFGKHPKEQLGWNSAFTNNLVLIFVSIDLIRHLYYQGTLFDFDIKLIIVGVVVFEGLVLMILDFYHLIPRKIAYGVSAKSPINFIALMAIILIYSNIPLDFITALAVFLMIFIFYIGLAVIYLLAFTPPPVEEEISK